MTENLNDSIYEWIRQQREAAEAENEILRRLNLLPETRRSAQELVQQTLVSRKSDSMPAGLRSLIGWNEETK